MIWVIVNSGGLQSCSEIFFLLPNDINRIRAEAFEDESVCVCVWEREKRDREVRVCMCVRVCVCAWVCLRERVCVRVVVWIPPSFSRSHFLLKDELFRSDQDFTLLRKNHFLQKKNPSSRIFGINFGWFVCICISISKSICICIHIC